MEEAVIDSSPEKLRCLLALIITACEPSNPATLWADFRDKLSEDFLYTHRRNINQPDAPYNAEVYNSALCYLEDKVRMLGGDELPKYDIPAPIRGAGQRLTREFHFELNYDKDQLANEANTLEQNLTVDQRRVFDDALALIDTGNIEGKTGNIIFLDAPGGTGKSYVMNCILKKIRSTGRIVLATATSGIAATLLEGGRTLHSVFKIPLDCRLRTEPTCSIKRGTVLADVIKECAAIVVDEAPMAHKACYEALDRSLRDIKGNESPMGGIPTLLCGDFRQILPVIQGGTRANIVNASLKKSYLWDTVIVRRITTNMRSHLSGDENSRHFSDLLLSVGNGSVDIYDEPDTINVPNGLARILPTLQDLKAAVYPDLANKFVNSDWLSERAILSPLNKKVSHLNNWLLGEFGGEQRTYKSIDTALRDDQATVYPAEFLNSIEMSGLPPHQLKLKVGVPVMIMRNIESPKTTNGTRCIVTRLHNNVIEASISCGPYKGETILLPRIPLVPSESDLPFQFRRLQFSCKPCFAMTVHKAQGQTFKTVGVDLSSPCFSHGQLYVACSRTGNPNSLYILTEKGQTRNVVYKEALQ